MSRKFLTILALVAPSAALAKPAYFNSLSGAYAGTQLVFSCNTCHMNGKPLNAYGKDFVQLRSQIGFNQLREVFGALAPLDSDGDGISNNDEILAQRNPGVAGK